MKFSEFTCFPKLPAYLRFEIQYALDVTIMIDHTNVVEWIKLNKIEKIIKFFLDKKIL